MKKIALLNNLLLCMVTSWLVGCSSVPNTVPPSTVSVIHHGKIPRVVYSEVTVHANPKIASYPIVEVNLNSHQHSSDDEFWDVLRKDFILEHAEKMPAVQVQLEWYQNHQKRLMNVLNSAAPYLYYIHQQAESRSLPGEFALLPLIESAFNPLAYSSAGASGLWQLMPGTATGFGLKHDKWYDGRRDIYASTQAALNYLTYLGTFFNNNWDLALAAYDSGEGTVEQAIFSNANRGYATDYWSLPLPRETQAYVPRLLALAIVIEHPSRYGIELPDIPNRPYFTAINVTKPINLENAAKLAGTTLETLQTLNPGYSHRQTDPNGPSRILLPVASVSSFQQNITRYEQDLLDETRKVVAVARHYKTHARDDLRTITQHFKNRRERRKYLARNNSVKRKKVHLVSHHRKRTIT